MFTLTLTTSGLFTYRIHMGDVVDKVPPAKVNRDLSIRRALLEDPEN